MEKEIKITVPEGYEIDEENSTFECIKFKKIESPRWRDKIDATAEGYYLSSYGVEKFTGKLYPNAANGSGKRFFATEKQAKSALAMAQISQIMANDERFGGVITDKEWKDYNINKYCIFRCSNESKKDIVGFTYYLLSFHTKEQRDLFLKENEDLVKQYLMIDEL